VVEAGELTTTCVGEGVTDGLVPLHVPERASVMDTVVPCTLNTDTINPSLVVSVSPAATYFQRNVLAYPPV
jgi:hypothetical protein